MKLLCLADLHQRMTDISDVIHQKRFTPFLQSMRDLCVDISLGDGGHGADNLCGQSEGVLRESFSVGYTCDCPTGES